LSIWLLLAGVGVEVSVVEVAVQVVSERALHLLLLLELLIRLQ
jgi:hypothetical protein